MHAWAVQGYHVVANVVVMFIVTIMITRTVLELSRGPSRVYMYLTWTDYSREESLFLGDAPVKKEKMCTRAVFALAAFSSTNFSSRGRASDLTLERC